MIPLFSAAQAEDDVAEHGWQPFKEQHQDPIEQRDGGHSANSKGRIGKGPAGASTLLDHVVPRAVQLCRVVHHRLLDTGSVTRRERSRGIMRVHDTRERERERDRKRENAWQAASRTNN